MFVLAGGLLLLRRRYVLQQANFTELAQGLRQVLCQVAVIAVLVPERFPNLRRAEIAPCLWALENAVHQQVSPLQALGLRGGLGRTAELNSQALLLSVNTKLELHLVHEEAVA